MRIAWILVFGLASLMALAACGGDDDDDTANDAGDQSTAAADLTDSDAEPADATDASDEDQGEGDGDDDDDDGDDDDDNGVSADHACSIITPEEVSAAVGFDVGEGRDYLAVAADATQCEWMATSGGSVVYAEVLTEGGRDWYEAVTFGFDDPDSPFGGEEVEGIGDEAVFDSLSLQVVEGDNYVSVQLVLFGSDVDQLTAAKALAQAILDKLE